MGLAFSGSSAGSSFSLRDSLMRSVTDQGSTTQIKPVCIWFCRPDVTNQSGVLSGS
jgi:hypothetical protein